MTGYFVFRQLYSDEIESIKKQGKNCLVFSYHKNVQNILMDYPEIFKDLRKYQNEINMQKDYHFITIDVLKAWSNLKVNNIRLGDFLSVEGVSLFDINFRTISNSFLRWTLMSLDLFSCILKNNSIDMIVIIGKDSNFEPYIRIVAKQLNIKIKNLFEETNFKNYFAKKLFLYRQLQIRSFKLLLKTFIAKLFAKSFIVTGDKKKSVLAFIFSDRYSKNLSPLFEYLGKSNNYNLFIINDLYGEKLNSLIKNRIKYQDMIFYSNWGNYIRIRNFYFELTNNLKKIFFADPYQINFAYNDFNLSYLVEELFLNKFYPALLVCIEKIILFRSLLKKEHPNLVLNCNDTKYVASIAHQEDIKCISLVPATMLELIYGGELISDKILVSTKNQKADLAKICDISNIEIIGDFYSNKVNFELLNKNAQEYKISRGISNYRKTVVFASTYSYENDSFYFSSEELKTVFCYVYEAVSKLKDAVLFTKMHPYEKDAFIHRKLANQFSLKKFILEKDIDISKILSVADVVIDTGSAIGIDAIILKKPLITIVPGRHVYSDIFSLQKYGLSELVFNEEQLYKALGERLYDERIKEEFLLKRQKYLNDNLFDGKANERVNSIIISLLEKSDEDIHKHSQIAKN